MLEMDQFDIEICDRVFNDPLPEVLRTAVLFDKRNPNHTDNADINQVLLRSVLNFFNMKLQRRGHLFLNEVYDELGFRRTVQGTLNGWLADGDSRVDFDLIDYRGSAYYDRYRKSFEDSGISLRNMAPNDFLLIMNVQGLIWDQI